MSFLRLETLTPSQAKEMEHMGFILKLRRLLCREWDEYEVYVL